MAIKRINPAAKFKVISSLDDALDNETAEEMQALRAEGKQSRYEAYLQGFDSSLLKFKDATKPTLFVVRPLGNFETAELLNRHYGYDTVGKTTKIKNISLMMLECFNIACLGVENEDGSVEKITAEQVPFGVAADIGGIINLIGKMDGSLKNG